MDVTATLRLQGDNLDPDAVTERLGVTPSSAHRKGDLNIGKDRKIYDPFSSGLWGIESYLGKSESIDDHIVHLLSRIDDVSDEWNQLISEGFTADIFVGVFAHDDGGNFGYSFPAHLMQRLADLSITVDFDVYS